MIPLGRPRDPARRGAVLTFPDHTTITRGQELEEATPIPWRPFPGSPQEAAYHSPARWIGYGGAAGGGKTDLLLGLAGTAHQRSLILRRTFPEVRGIIERSREVYNTSAATHAKDSYNEQLHLWRLASGRLVEMGSCQYLADREKYRGRPYDLHGFDEATGFPEEIVRFVAGWNRTATPGQPCRVVLTFNPPTDEAGRWVIRFFLPWMAFLYPDLEECKAYTGTPARPGELRWYLYDPKAGTDVEVPEGTPKAQSRTFFPARVEDNPVYMATGYDATLEALPEPLRSQMRYGSFTAGMKEDPWQAIPRAWVRAAMARWTPEGYGNPEAEAAIGVDPARGGQDQTAIAIRRGAWFAPLLVVPGVETPTGPAVAALVQREARALPAKAEPAIFVDVIGIGASAYDSLEGSPWQVEAVNVGAGSKDSDRSGRLQFGNLRAEKWWKFREALDPDHGDGLSLPEDPDLLTELCSPRYTVRSGKIWIESKDEVRERIGRSTDRADAVILAHQAQRFYAD
jgi:hypothetical protein